MLFCVLVSFTNVVDRNWDSPGSVRVLFKLAGYFNPPNITTVGLDITCTEKFAVVINALINCNVASVKWTFSPPRANSTEL